MTPRSRLRARLGAAVALLAVLATACSQTQVQNSLDDRGPAARQVNDLFRPVGWIAVAVFFLVQFLVLYSAIRFRARSDDDRPKQVHGNAKLEIGWTVLPAVLLFGVGIATVGTLITLDREREGPDVLQVEVVGHQWWWEYRYPEAGAEDDHGEGAGGAQADAEVVTANELHIPVGRKVNLRMTSTDVIHSFWPPKLAGKVDVVPGRTNHMWLEADEPGTYHGQCAEFCGLSHANMRVVVVAHEEADFQAWLEHNRGGADTPTDGTDAAEGLALFKAKGCIGCHTVDGVSVGTFGPNLTHLYDRETFAGAIFDLNEENLRRWLRDPPAEKPMVQNGKNLGMPNLELTEDEITKLIAYLETLK